MKRSWLITIFICLLLLGGGGAVLFLPQVVPFDQCSDVYKKYAGMDGVDATFIRDYKVNDTVYVDVTYIEATTDSSWNEIKRDFQISIPPEIMDLYDSNSVDLKFAPHNNYSSPKDSILINNDIIVFAYFKQTVLVFDIKDEKQSDAIINRQIINTINKKNEQ